MGKLVIYCLMIFALLGCSNSPKIYDQVPLGTEAVIYDDIRVWRDHRGIFYYVNSSGSKTREPLRLSQKECSKNNRYNNAYVDLQCEVRKRWDKH